jgi:hypothetical protein
VRSPASASTSGSSRAAPRGGALGRGRHRRARAAAASSRSGDDDDEYALTAPTVGTPARSRCRARTARGRRSRARCRRPSRRPAGNGVGSRRRTRARRSGRPARRRRAPVLQRPHSLVAESAGPIQRRGETALPDVDRHVLQQLCRAADHRRDRVRVLVRVGADHDHPSGSSSLALAEKRTVEDKTCLGPKLRSYQVTPEHPDRRRATQRKSQPDPGDGALGYARSLRVARYSTRSRRCTSGSGSPRAFGCRRVLGWASWRPAMVETVSKNYLTVALEVADSVKASQLAARQSLSSRFAAHPQSKQQPQRRRIRKWTGQRRPRTAVCRNWTASLATHPLSPRKRPAKAGLSCVSGRQDLNLRPPGPQPGALPDCATPRGASSASGRRESNPP